MRWVQIPPTLTFDPLADPLRDPPTLTPSVTSSVFLLSSLSLVFSVTYLLSSLNIMFAKVYVTARGSPIIGSPQLTVLHRCLLFDSSLYTSPLSFPCLQG